MDYQLLFSTVAIFGLIFVTLVIIYQLSIEKKINKKRIAQRLEQLSENNPEFVKVSSVNLFQNKRKNMVERKINDYLIKIKKENELKLIIQRMGFNFTITQMVLMFFISTFIIYLIMTLFYNLGIFIDIIAAVTLTLALFVFTINIIISSRQKKFLKELPFAIEILIRSVKSGFSLDRALKIVSKEIKEPLGSELQNLVRKIELGVSFQQTFRDSSSRIKLREYTFFCNSLIIQHETGGHLEYILNNILTILKKNMDLKLKIKSITAEIKTTGVILAITPVVILFLVGFTKPDYIDFFTQDPAGIGIFKKIIFLFVLECFVIYYMLRMKVE